MTKDNLLQHIDTLEVLANGSRLKRLLNNPFKYIYAIFLKNGLYPVFHKEVMVRCKLFTGQDMQVLLPASTDIYLTKGKSHASEIRLARFLVHNLRPGNTFWDIGAHYGYFSLLAHELTGDRGHIVAVEAAPVTFNILHKNCNQKANITILNKAVSDQPGKATFYELPNLYSEYNSVDVSQFEQEEWFKKIKAKKVVLDAVTLDALAREHSKHSPDIIKIDVEGAEAAVIRGALQLLSDPLHHTTLVMEFLAPERNNRSHNEAVQQLKQLGYKTYSINQDGSLSLVADVEQYLVNRQLDSDNIVLKRS
ncbi:MAG: FkbM family methyltransferase [Sphingobacteriales bacterium]|nr:MAG: FkbM family methyltransferase [Sphingobacteriales bacterium]